MDQINNKNLNEYFNGDELAANVWKSKYAQENELLPDDMHWRMAKEFARIDEKYQQQEENFNPGVSEYGFYRESLGTQSIYELFKNFKYIVPQGSIMSTLGTNLIASLSNCWVIESPIDSYAGIHKSDGDLIYYYKRRGGVGMDISNLRPANTFTNNTAKSSTGAVSFMNRFSNTTREVAMNGRRGALMISIDVNHPDVMDFIKIKRDLTQVTGANVSIRLNNEFMKAVERNEDYILRFPCDFNDFSNHKEFIETLPYNVLDNIEENKVYIKKIKAKEYWDEMIKSARDFAEPGLMYWDNIINNDPCSVYEQYKPITSNPCGEQFLNANDSCRLLAINLFSFVENPFTENAHINFQKLYQICYEALRLGDNLVDLEAEYIDRIIEKIKSDPEPYSIKEQELDLWIKSKEKCLAGRRIGLGITALGDMLAALNVKYDSDETLSIINTVMYTKMEAELDCTIDLSILRGSFKGFESNDEFVGDAEAGVNNFYQFLIDNFPKQAKRMSMCGRRNVNWSTVAPTGSVSILTQTSSGVEPLFMPYYMRRKKINPNDADTRIDFVDQNGDKWQEFPVLHPKFKDWIDITYGKGLIDYISKEELHGYFEKSPWHGSTANDIDWKKRVEIQAILQKYTTNAISSTINLPSTVTYEEVSNIYMHGWKMGLKGQTVYVDGSRTGVLVSENTKTKETFSYTDAVKRPESIPCDIYHLKTKGLDYTVLVGILDEKPYEVFAIEGILAKDCKKGFLFKKKKGKYDLVTAQKYEPDGIKAGDYIHVDTNISQNMNDEQQAVTRLISIALRHGADVKFVVEQLNKTNGFIGSFTKTISRSLKKYIEDNEKSSISCENCGSSNVIFEEGCNKCLECGSSKCS